MVSEEAARKRAQNLIPGGKSMGGPGAGISPNMTVRIPAATRARLDTLAASAGMKTSKYVRDIIDRHLADNPGSP